jgi:hypothetical protein
MHLKHNNTSGLIIQTCVLMIFLILGASPLYGQKDCATKIQEAQKFYDQGMIEEIPQMLDSCMQNGFSPVQKIAAYKLIILSYLFDDNQFEAEKTMVEFLKKFPEYEIMPNDPVEFVYLFESYRTTSVFSFGLTAGFNLTDPRVIRPYTVFDMRNVSLKNSMKAGFQVGIGVGRYISKRMFFNVEFQFSENRYGFTDEIIIPLKGGFDGINSVNYSERLYKAELPFSISYEFNAKKVHYFIRTGFSVARLTGVTGISSRKYAEEMPVSTGETRDIELYRKHMLYGGMIGTGARYKVPRGVLTVELRANLGLNNIVRPEKRFDVSQQINKTYYIDDNFSLNTFSLSAGYYFSFYKPKKQIEK